MNIFLMKIFLIIFIRIGTFFRSIQKYSEVHIFSQNFSYKWILKYSEISHLIIFKKYFLIFLDFVTFYQKLYLQKNLKSYFSKLTYTYDINIYIYVWKILRKDFQRNVLICIKKWESYKIREILKNYIKILKN